MSEIVDEALSIVAKRDAYASAFRVERPSYGIMGAIYDSSGGLIGLSQRQSGIRGDRVNNIDPLSRKFDPDIPRLRGRHLYLGHLMGHYGHFLTETLSTFWAVSIVSDAKPVFHPFIFGAEIKPFMKPFLESFGIDDVTIVREDTVFDEIIVPERAFRVNTSAHIEMRRTYRTIKKHILSTMSPVNESKLVFVSRARLPKDARSMTNDSEFDIAVARLGFRVIYPEEIPIAQQIAIYANADVLCGFAGSALHNSVFMKEGAQVIELGDVRSPNRPVWGQTVCDQLAQVRPYHIPYQPSGERTIDIPATIAALSEVIRSPSEVL